jgi:uncharacterized protein YoxC
MGNVARSHSGADRILFGLLLGKSYHDVWKTVDLAKTQIQSSVQQGQAEVTNVSAATKDLTREVNQLQSDIDKYRKVNNDIGTLQKQIQSVQAQVVDLGTKGLRVNELETTGSGPSSIALGHSGCPSSTEGANALYCAKGSPVTLFQLSPTGDLHPVSSQSPIGFQDVSVESRPACTAAKRGTLYVEKGKAGVSDNVSVCMKKSDNTFQWVQMANH